jgi:hypothetical protein
MRVWVRRCIGVAFVGVIVAGCSSGWSAPTVTMGNRDHAVYPMGAVVAQLRKACPASKGDVVLHLVDARVRHTFTCAAVRQPVNRVESLLVQAVAPNRSAGKRADQVVSLDRALGFSYMTRGALTWLLGTAFSDFSCDRASDVQFRRAEIQEAGGVGENPTHWLKVEAAFIAGACPDRLDTLYQTVMKAGQPAAVATVRPELSAVMSG